jgi:hypothetical protein
MVTKQEDETYCVDEEVSSSMILKPTTTHALSDTMSISGEHWIIEAVLLRQALQKGSRGQNLSMGRPAGVMLLHSLLPFLCITAR